MELICKITDEDIGEESRKPDNPRLRLAARGIVVREDGKIAIFNKRNKNEYYSTKFIVLRDRKILEKYIELRKEC